MILFNFAPQKTEHLFFCYNRILLAVNSKMSAGCVAMPEIVVGSNVGSSVGSSVGSRTQFIKI